MLQNRHDGFFAGRIDNGKLHAALLNVHYVLGSIALRKNRSLFGKVDNFSRYPGRVEKRLRVKAAP